MSSNSRLRTFVEFAIVGAIGVAVNEGILLALLAAQVYLILASTLAIEISILSNFVLNDLWTFRDRRSGSAFGRLLKFNALMLVGLVVNAGVLDASHDYLGMSAAVGNLLGIAVAFVFRYALSVRYAWMKFDAQKTVKPVAA